MREIIAIEIERYEYKIDKWQKYENGIPYFSDLIIRIKTWNENLKFCKTGIVDLYRFLFASLRQDIAIPATSAWSWREHYNIVLNRKESRKVVTRDYKFIF